MVEADGSQLATVYSPHGRYLEAHAPDISPDGDRVLYMRRFKTKGRFNYELVSSALDGSEERRLTENEANDVTPVWSPDGTRIAFLSDRLGHLSEFTLFTMAADGSDVRSLAADIRTPDHSPPVWSPNGRYLAFLGEELVTVTDDSTQRSSSRWQSVIHTVRWDGVDLRRLSASGGEPAWSSDGMRIAFFGGKNGGSAMFEIGRDGTGLRAVFELEKPYPSWGRGHLRWSPDGSEIRYGRYPLVVVKTDGSQARAFKRSLNSDEIDRAHGMWSPDGSRIAVQIQFDENAVPQDREVVLFTMRPDGSDKLVLIRRSEGKLVAGEGQVWNPRYDFEWEDVPTTSALNGTTAPPCAEDSSSYASCEPRDVSGIGLFTPNTGGAAYDTEEETPTVEELVEKGMFAAEASPTHIVFRGTGLPDSVRCEWQGIARTLVQREQAIRFWLGMDDSEALPSAAEVERQFTAYVELMGPTIRDTMRASLTALARGGLTTEYSSLNCYADYTVHEYLLGSGPTTLTVAYDMAETALSYDLYVRAHTSGRFEDQPLMTEGEHRASLDQLIRDAESSLSGIVGDRESVAFLAPMGSHNAIAFEAWQVIAQWDLQIDDDQVVHAVRHGTLEGDPEHTQTLADLKSRVTAAAASDAFAGKRIANIGEVTQHYKDIGAYDDITPDDGSTDTFTPAQPPPVYAPPPESLTATAQGERNIDLTWTAVTGSSGYHVQYRIAENEGSWSTSSETVSGTSHTVTDLACGLSHEFRVGSYGDGTSVNKRAGLWSESASATPENCVPESGVTLTVSPGSSVGHLVWVKIDVDVTTLPAGLAVEKQIQVQSWSGTWNTIITSLPYAVRAPGGGTLNYRAAARLSGSSGEYVHSEPVRVTWEYPP